MSLITDEEDLYSILDAGFDRNLNRMDPFSRPPDMRNEFIDGIASASFGSGEMLGNLVMKNGDMRSSNFITRRSGWQIKNDGTAEFQNVDIGNRFISITEDDDIDEALDTLRDAGGGTLFLRAGNYTISTSLVGFSNLKIIGSSSANTTLTFTGTANLSFSGTDIYTTGTITSVANGVTVTGSGTSWLSNVTTDHQIFIGKRWYKIAAVVNDTTIILGEGFAGLGSLDSFPSVSYRAAKVVQGIDIEEVTFTGSSVTGITFDDCRDVALEDIVVTNCNKGIVFTNSAQISANRVILPANTSNGIEFQTSGFTISQGVSSAGNGGVGMIINDCRVMPYQFCSMSANTGNGVSVTASDTIVIEIEAASNGAIGIEMVSGNINIFVQDSLVDSNTSDGVKLTASSDSCKIVIATITNNGGWGINSVASTNDDLIVSNNVVEDNTSGSITDTGVGSVYSGNKGIIDKKTEKATNVSGGSLAVGNVVVFGAVTTTTVFNPDADAESTSVDGRVGRSGVNEAWSTIRDGAGTFSGDTDTATDAVMIRTSATTNQFDTFIRSIFLFDTSSIPAGATISSATFELYATTKDNSLGNLAFILTGSTPASNTGLVSADYGQLQDTFLSDSIAVDSITLSAYNLWTLNASGRAAITAAGITKLGFRIDNDAQDSEVGWGNTLVTKLGCQYADGANAPKLTVVYTVGSGDGVRTTTVAGDDGVFGMAEEIVADDATGSIQTEGETVLLKVNGTTDISVGDFLTTYTEVGIAAKAATGDMAFAIALEAYATNDSSGVIDARLVSPRKL